MADVCEPASPAFASPFTKKCLSSSQLDDSTKSPLHAKELTSEDVKSSPLRRPFANITNAGPLKTDELGASPMKRDFQCFSGSQVEVNLAGSQLVTAEIDSCTSDDDIFTPRKTPKRRSVLLSRNQDVIDKYRCSMDGADKGHSSVNPERVMAESLAQDDQMVAELQKELKQSNEARAMAEQKLTASQQEVEEAQKRVALLEAEVEAEHQTQVGRREAQKLRKTLAQHEVLFELLCRHVDAETVLKCEAVAGIKHHAEADGEVGRHSLEVMKTLPEEEDGEEAECGGEAVDGGAEASAEALSVLATLKKELAAGREEAERLRQTADACWVREQAACKRVQELEEENRELNAFTQQMAQAHSRLSAGVQELTEKQKEMVPAERLQQSEAELAAANAALDKEQQRVREVEGKLQEYKNEAWAEAEAKIEEMEATHAETYRVLSKRIRFLQEELAESSLEGERLEGELDEEQAKMELLYGAAEASFFSPRKRPRRKLGCAPRSPLRDAAGSSAVVVARGRGGRGLVGTVVWALPLLLCMLLAMLWPQQPPTPMPLIV